MSTQVRKFVSALMAEVVILIAKEQGLI